MKQALAQKELGSVAYKARDFAAAITHFEAARALHPTDPVYLLNKAAAFLELKDYTQCIATCEAAVDVAMENRADFTVHGKAYARAAKAYTALGQLEDAIKFYDKALSNDRNADYLKAKQALQKQLKEQQRLAYIDPEKSREAKERGNELFKKGDWPGAIHEYDEAAKRNPDDSRIYSNRAACFTKLMEFDRAAKDCDECIRLDPTFAKGYLRKANALLGLQRHDEAVTAFRKALELDPANEEARQGLDRVARDKATMNSGLTREERVARASKDPEVIAIMNDPAMNTILRQMQEDPKAVQEHLKNPVIRAKIQKLAESGILEMR